MYDTETNRGTSRYKCGTGMLSVRINKAKIFEERRTAERAVRGAGIIPQIAIGVLQIIRHTDRFFGSVI